MTTTQLTITHNQLTHLQNLWARYRADRTGGETLPLESIEDFTGWAEVWGEMA